MYSKLIDLYTFDITETRHIHWMVYALCYYSNHFEDLVKFFGKNENGIQAHGHILVELKDKRTSITLKNVALENLLKRYFLKQCF